ncbi:spore coat protein YjzB [Bacillus subtilis]|uniref:spore coat protein YjzB n=1 Tax=Bacillus subtilis TaxID=1423 RepID=UPI0009B1B894|nr:spore coat protein YjzB [Bacillus subtilis]WBC27960.1 spore coat protein YjzB [Bacillus subtilis]
MQLDVFSRMMFGDAAKPTEEKEEQQEEVSQVSQTNDEETINYMHIMDQIGSIMNSIDQIKPALKELAPMLSAIKKKIM